ncbi:PREDICTED: uncharacterized protein LOC108765979 [Trachymyrmex cornetzi]|uniref:uncharacterized protein LOC108765979 n=1 Tax=Trachymyrmex cornetzi TaxID=471704 RepID=UPI00084F2F32|nr:PREDICTED: uncharacterized protein LOC108765979 [Trachymyrmex cornetzi]
MAFLRLAFLISYIILISNVTLYRGADNNENVMEDGTDYALKKSHRYSVIEENFSEESQDEGKRIESPLQDALKTAKCYIESRNSESLKKILSATCAPDEEKQI